MIEERALRRVSATGTREVGYEEHAVFPTPYTPLDSEYAREYAEYGELHDVHVWSWRHREPAPVTLLLTHGWGVGPWWMHRHEYDVPYLFHRLGLDVYFYLAPFHGLRTPAQARMSGQLHPSPDLVRTNEAFIQTAIEVRALISAIQRRNSAPLGMMGSSLGGYTSALLASLDDRLNFVIPVLPPASMAHLLWDHGEGELRERAEVLGMSRERFHRSWSLHSPLTHTAKVPWARADDRDRARRHAGDRRAYARAVGALGSASPLSLPRRARLAAAGQALSPRGRAIPPRAGLARGRRSLGLIHR
ncbi:MAG: alpha/beta hydrolase family protein [Deltaproteobacteria bacterium]|nr:alpha/beta hydrolase family protein [Deltaproteobacteria bacterium]